MDTVEVVFPRQYFYRFAGRSPEDKGLYTPIMALDEEQAAEFAESIAHKLATLWGVEAVTFERYYPKR